MLLQWAVQVCAASWGTETARPVPTIAAPAHAETRMPVKKANVFMGLSTYQDRRLARQAALARRSG